MNHEEPIEVHLKLRKIAKKTFDDLILLDNQASVSVFGNGDHLSNLRTARPCNISAISSDTPISSSQNGDYHDFVGINTCSGATANILSFSETRKYCTNDYDKERNLFTATTPDGNTFTFA